MPASVQLQRRLAAEGHATWTEAVALRRRLRKINAEPALEPLRIAMRDAILRKEVSALVDIETADLLDPTSSGGQRVA